MKVKRKAPSVAEMAEEIKIETNETKSDVLAKEIE